MSSRLTSTQKFPKFTRYVYGNGDFTRDVYSDDLVRRDGVLRKKVYLPVSETNPRIDKNSWMWTRVDDSEEEALRVAGVID